MDDYATTAEETPVVIPVLENDDENGDDDEDENRIDPSSVDINPDTDEVDHSLTQPAGSFTVNDDGEVRFVPSVNFYGEHSIRYTIKNYGGDTSDPADVFITVLNVNDAPVITGQTPDPLTSVEDAAFEITFDHLVVSDPDDTYPDGFTLAVSAGEHYTVDGATVHPAQDFSGTLTIPVSVNDGEDDSNTFQFSVSVTAVNDAPVIAGQSPDPLTTAENTAVTIEPANLEVTDPDNAYPEDFTLQAADGDNYTRSGNTITPDAGFEGMLSVPVTVNDGALNSNIFSMNVQVAAGTNSAPVITGQSALGMEEDHSIAIAFSDLQVTDSDDTYPEGFTMFLSPGDNYTVSGTTVTPVTDFHGTLSVPVTVNDGTSDSEPFNLSISVSPVNDAPEITGQSALTVPEGQSIELRVADLVVKDPDNNYPDDFTLSVLAGSNYTVSGNHVTPDAGFTGVLVVGIFVSDFSSNSPVYDLQVTVTPVNDVPVITGQKALTAEEDNTFTIALSDLTVTDSDNEYPDDFTLTVLPGGNYTTDGAVITPLADYNGLLTVNVKVNDGISDSEPFAAEVAITAVNDAPLISGHVSLSTPEDQPLTITFDDLVVSDPDNDYPAGFTLTVHSGSDYTVSGHTITPAQDFQGTLHVPVQVNDGSVDSNIFEISVQVSAGNDVPVIVGQTPVSTSEDTPVTILLSHLEVVDADNEYPEDFTLKILSGQNYTFSGTTVTPAADFTGTLGVGITVNDGTSDSAPFTFQIQVGDANDPPIITGQAELDTDEEQPFTLLLSHLTVTDPDDPYPAGFSLLISPGDNFTVAGSTITPAANFAGMLSVAVRVNDGVNNSAAFDLQLRVNQVNDAPFFDPVSDQRISENSAPVKVAIKNISKGPGESDQQLTFVARSGNTAIIPDPAISYDGTASTATLTYAPVPNASGIVNMTITAIDNGAAAPPHENSYSSSFQVEVLEINLAPTLDPIAGVAVAEDAPLQNIALSGITAGAGENQPLTVKASVDRPQLLEVFEVVYTSPENKGTLRIKPAANASGTAKITVTVTDNGSSVSPSANSVSRAFSFSITQVNDPPVFLTAPVVLVAAKEPYAYTVEVSDIENQTVTFSLPSKPSWLTLMPVGHRKAKLSGTPVTSGNAGITIRVKDGDITVEQQYTLLVNTRPDVTPLSIALTEDQTLNFQPSQLTSAYSDADGHAMTAIQITELPASGSLLLGDAGIAKGDTIPAASLASLVYKPGKDYAGPDGFSWKAFDGHHFSAQPAAVTFAIAPVNDPPVVSPGPDTLLFDVNGEAVLLSPSFVVEDPDNDSLVSLDIAIKPQSFEPEADRLFFETAGAIKGAFDFQTGRLRLTGHAPIGDYIAAIRSVEYNYLNTVDPTLGFKQVSFTASDGKLSGQTKDRLLLLQYTFVELDIPSGFTPNGDQVNDTWIISREGGLEQLQRAVIRVFNRRGVQVFQGVGFESQWDGKLNGELLPADSYFFTIDLRLKNKKVYSGVVTILR